MADKLRAQQQLEALQARFIGTGNADTTKFEWTSNVARDSLTSYIGHPTMLQYMSIGLGQPRERTRIQLIERMIQPVGKPPEATKGLSVFIEMEEFGLENTEPSDGHYAIKENGVGEGIPF